MCEGGKLFKRHSEVFEARCINSFNKSSSILPSTCHIHIRVSETRSEPDLSSLIGCPIINAVLVNACLSWKGKIHKQCFCDALQHSFDTHFFRIWRNNHPKASPTASSSSPPISVNASSYKGISDGIVEATMHSSIHYLKELLGMLTSFYRSIGCGHMNCPLSVLYIRISHMLLYQTSV